MGIPGTFLQLNHVLLQFFLKQADIFADKFKRVLDGEYFMGTMPALCIGAINTKQFMLRNTIQSKYVVMLQTADRHLTTTHQPQQLNSSLQSLTYPSQLSRLSLQKFCIIFILRWLRQSIYELFGLRLIQSWNKRNIVGIG